MTRFQRTPLAGLALAAVAATVVAAGAVGAGQPLAIKSSLAAARSSKTPFRVTSTLDGKKTLPHRIHWIARPSAPAFEVRFLIDGKARWIEHDPPFSYSEDGGYLVTSWLSPGRHRFAVQATSVNGARAIDTVLARVTATARPPSELAGTWERAVPEPVPPDPAFPGDAVPAGRWTIVFDRRWIENHFPGKLDPATSPRTGAGNVLLDDYTAGPRTFSVFGAVTTGRIKPLGSVANAGGWWCAPGGPKAVYSWSVSGSELTLRPVARDACSQRGGVFTGRWTRVG
jgi:hypothetical protein